MSSDKQGSNKILNFKDYLEYSELSKTGLVWVVQMGNNRCKGVGQEAGCLCGNRDYWVVTALGVRKYAHRVIWEIVNGPIPNDMQIDHFDGNKLNNKISNLRLVTAKTNRQNLRKNSSNTSGYTGVIWVILEGKTYAKAYTKDNVGKLHQRTFSVLKYGLLPAFKMACNARESLLMESNQNGCNYTVNHGK